jgi:hypothetical protein
MRKGCEEMIFDDYYADCAYWCPVCGDPLRVVMKSHILREMAKAFQFGWMASSEHQKENER